MKKRAPFIVMCLQHWISTKAQVHAFYDSAIAAGATCDGPPGPRPLYSDAYYGCFVRDLDGHKIEAAFWDEELAAKLQGH
jgi:predicted lactoylglutathione lyase